MDEDRPIRDIDELFLCRTQATSAAELDQESVYLQGRKGEREREREC